MNRTLQTSARQQGAVLLVSLLMLLVTTFIGFSAMETSNLESKMATSRELKELTFQTAEAVIEESLDNFTLISDAYAVGLAGTGAWPVAAYTFDHDTELTGGARVEFINNANSLGYSIRKGASGIATYYYQVIGSASRANTNISSVHTQGIYVEGPSLN
ncbi:MAG: PilX N-terminal domain-containing pilus assembly protein [Halieaceae bacterium]